MLLRYFGPNGKFRALCGDGVGVSGENTLIRSVIKLER